MLLKLPGLMDPHVHIRVPGGTHKEDWCTGTGSALAGGITTILAMPNTAPPLTTRARLADCLQEASQQAVCDYGVYAGGSPTNVAQLDELADLACGLKLYLDDTFGELCLDWRDLPTLTACLSKWRSSSPVVCHAEARSIPAIILLAHLARRSVHIAHVSRASEIAVIEAAKERGFAVTCEVAPHHLFLSTDDLPALGAGWGEVRPRLATPADQAALWDALQRGVIDCIATDHAPHLPREKSSANPPPGFPGLETSLALMLTAVQQGRLSIEQLMRMMDTNPRRIFGIKDQEETFIEVAQGLGWEVKGASFFSKSKWSPFEGWQLIGKVQRVTLRGKVVFEDGEIKAPPGFGRAIERRGWDSNPR